ncbi:MAG TPA: dethiobiotin synthase [Candidatus Rubrimentiphilum sp.]|nr:dethiobiotin synthase [Candidatus Rubrimentiphilum sp.]
MHRYLITGTDTDVGKTRVSAALALRLRAAGEVTIVKLVQTGLSQDAAGDCARASALAGCTGIELARFTRAADPWSAALADGVPPVHAADLVQRINAVEGAVVAEGAGGLAVPLNRTENFASVAKAAPLAVLLVIGLRLGCMNHALLTIDLCRHSELSVAGAVLVDRWERSEASYVEDVQRVLQGKINVLGILPFERDEAASVSQGAALFDALIER